ncbi:hypothetical protein EDC04DRAFT_3142101, partial [Pisolithus marmoratus]
MALAGKDLGKDVMQWFGPSTAASAIKTLVHTLPEAGLGVAVATDGVVYQTDAYSASNVHMRSPWRLARSSWGGRAVLVLVGSRLKGVNPYCGAIKALFTLPQSAGIAGGRPLSSYYFLGSQADNLFYLDPHHPRSAVPLVRRKCIQMDVKVVEGSHKAIHFLYAIEPSFMKISSAEIASVMNGKRGDGNQCILVCGARLVCGRCPRNETIVHVAFTRRQGP